MSKTIKFTTLAVLVIVLAWVLVGCGSKQSSDGGSSGAQVTTYKIGLGAPLTANAVAVGQGLRRGALVAIDELNASAKAKELGIKFELLDGDDQGDPKMGVNVANQFASDNAMVGVMGHLNSGVSIPASKVYNDASMVMISAASTAPELTAQGFDNVFRVCATDDVQGPVAAEVAYSKLGLKTAVIIDDSSPYGEGLAAQFEKKFTELGGTVLLKEKTNDKETEFSSLVTKVNTEKPDVIYFGGIYTSAGFFIKQLRESGNTSVLLGGDAFYEPQLIELAGAKNAEGTLCTLIGLPADKLPSGQQFVDAYKAKYPDETMSSFDAYGHDATLAIGNAALEAATKVGADKLTSPAGRDAIIQATHALSFTGATGEVSFDDKGDTTNKAITVYRVENGELTPYILPGE